MCMNPPHLKLRLSMASRLVLNSVAARNSPVWRPTWGKVPPCTMAWRRMTLGGPSSCITMTDEAGSYRYTWPGGGSSSGKASARSLVLLLHATTLHAVRAEGGRHLSTISLSSRFFVQQQALHAQPAL